MDTNTETLENLKEKVVAKVKELGFNTTDGYGSIIVNPSPHKKTVTITARSVESATNILFALTKAGATMEDYVQGTKTIHVTALKKDDETPATKSAPQPGPAVTVTLNETAEDRLNRLVGEISETVKELKKSQLLKEDLLQKGIEFFNLLTDEGKNQLVIRSKDGDEEKLVSIKQEKFLKELEGVFIVEK